VQRERVTVESEEWRIDRRGLVVSEKRKRGRRKENNGKEEGEESGPRSPLSLPYIPNSFGRFLC
jgi:hypothetical protein